MNAIRKRFKLSHHYQITLIENPPVKYRRLKIYNAYGGRCYLCLKPLAFCEMSVDHVTPKVDGGKNHLCNLASSCVECNKMKGVVEGLLPSERLTDNQVRTVVRVYSYFQRVLRKTN